MLLRRSLLAAGLLCLILTSACTTTSRGEPRPTATDTSPSSSVSSGNGDEELPFAGAPRVEDPLDTSRYEQDPCLSLTADQTEPLNLPGAGEINDRVALGIGCDWVNQETRGEVTINFITKDPRGLSPEYESENQGEFPNFTELPDIEGYPVITREGASKYGDCTVVVGVADDMAFESIVQLSQANVGQKDPCDVAVQVAGLALQTMKAGA